MNTQIGSLLVSNPDFRQGRPCIAGTAITVHRVALWYKLGHTPEEITRRYGHLNEAQVYAALAYYHANRAQIEAELDTDEQIAEQLEQEFQREKQLAL